MNSKLKYLPGLLAVGIIWFGLAAWSFLKPADNFSDSERRNLMQFPEITAESLLSGKFMTDLKDYSLDQFPMRDSFRTLKAISSFYLFGKKDNNDIYIADGYAAKIEYPLNENSVNKAADKLVALYEKYVKETGASVYLSVIPDKGFYLAAKNGYPKMDYDKLTSIMKNKMYFAKYIDVTDTLEISDYYKTDTHWRQEYILDVADVINSAMGTGSIGEYTIQKADVPFYGVYYGQAALPLPSETIYYVTNDMMESCTVKNIETGKSYTGMIDFERLSGKDPYEIFLSGASPIIEITNPEGKTDKELVVFRDSYGSSIVPLLVADYSKVTLVDTRYIVPDFVGSYVNFEEATDVLFMYSSVILNQSNALK